MAAWVIISGSPYANGKCYTATRALAAKLQISPSEHGEDSAVKLFSCASLNVHGCIGCDRCKDSFTCIYRDDQPDLMTALDTADAALIISPIYFAGVPSQFKAVLDRFQPYFWKRQKELAEGRERPEKRPLYVALVGEGGDPYGSKPALAQIASPLALANFAIRSSHAFIRANLEDILSGIQDLIFTPEAIEMRRPTDPTMPHDNAGASRP